jgi:putative nucleotidyltransferase with HDIG domain
VEHVTKKVIDMLNQVPTLPDHIVALIDALDCEDTEISEIVNMIEADQVLNTDILKLANSAFYDSLQRFSDVRDVVSIGKRTVRNLIAGTAALNFFAGSAQLSRDEMELWEHLIICAFLAKMLTKEASVKRLQGASMIGGLTHDIGKIFIARYFPESFAPILQRVQAEGLTFYQAEKQILRCTHDQIGATLLKRWGFPDEIVSCVLHHHAPWTDLNCPDITATVYLANLLSKRMGHPSNKKEFFSNNPWYKNAKVMAFFKRNGLPVTREDLDIFLVIAEARLAMESSNLFSIFSVTA